MSVIDEATSSVVNTISTGISQPYSVAINPSGTRLLVANYNANNVAVVDTASNSTIANIAVGNGPIAIAMSPSGNLAYVANANSNNVSVIDVGILQVTATINAGQGARGIATVR